MVEFQQEGYNQEYSIYLNPGFTPLKVEESTCYSRGSQLSPSDVEGGRDGSGCHLHKVFRSSVKMMYSKGLKLSVAA